MLSWGLERVQRLQWPTKAALEKIASDQKRALIVFLVQKEDRFVARTMLDLREHMGQCGGVDPVLSNGEIYAIWSSL